jgi:hypothetical protein
MRGFPCHFMRALAERALVSLFIVRLEREWLRLLRAQALGVTLSRAS